MNVASPFRKAIARLAVALGLVIVAPVASAQAATPPGSPVEVNDWDVYVDLPTHFAFVKTPKSWVFVRRLDDEQMTRLPASTLTTLLPVEPTGIRYAHPALEPSPHGRTFHDGETRQAGAAVADLTRQR